MGLRRASVENLAIFPRTLLFPIPELRIPKYLLDVRSLGAGLGGESEVVHGRDFPIEEQFG